MPQISDFLALIASNALVYGGSFLLVLGILVFVHEFGHYIVARWCGVRAEVFSVGFGREIFGYTDKRGTRWKFSLIPLGGYVKMFGDVDPTSSGHTEKVVDGEGNVHVMTEAERNVAFFTKSVWRRMAIVFAGPGINYLFAILIMSILYMAYGQPITPPQAAAIVVGSAADKAGFEPQDVILKIGDRNISRFEDIRREIAVKLDVPTEFTILREGKTVRFTASPERLEEKDTHGFKQSRGVLGVISPGNGIDLKSIKDVDGVKVKDVDDARQKLLARMGKSSVVSVSGGVTDKGIRIHPLADKNVGLKDPQSKTYNSLIITDGESEKVITHGPIDAVTAAVSETYKITVSTLEAIGQIFTGTRKATELGGIIRIGAIAGDMAQTGFIALVTFMALLSINLGLINLFPVPMLDGGHLVFYSIEAIRGKPIPEQIQEYAYRLGLAILVGIMVFANLNDVMQLVLQKV
ncbi:MAG: Intrarane protease RasP/YluC, implicated in cell division based on FtsL cleavage [Micavibrio sp.]|nr:Intrarane protease RasP/YluC, implicated in cell division based on FtsL cleavage [Micavibrio sp.]